MSKWSKLQKNDVVDIVAPGFKSSKDKLEEASKFIEAIGLRPRFQKGIISKSLLFSASDEVRAQHLISALAAEDSKMVWCLRGGYGAQRLLPVLSKMRKPKQTKLVMGYSDVTALHTFLNQNWDWATAHGPVLDGVKTLNEMKQVRQFIFGATDYLEFGLKPLNPAAFKTKSIRGTVRGGNLSVLAAGLATPWQVKPRSQILVLEDVGERAYSLDRMLVQMEQAGVFKSVRAVVLGDFVGGEEFSGRSLVNSALKEFFLMLDIPVFRGLRVGHGKTNRTLPLNTKAELIIKKDVTLKVECGFKR